MTTLRLFPRFPWIGLVVLVVVSCGGVSERLPNVVVIVVDDLGYGEIFGTDRAEIPTPRIDSIARDGVAFTHAYTCSPLCSPSRAGLLTGRYPQRFGVELNDGGVDRDGAPTGLPPGERTVADRLRERGYKTGFVGKWHLGHVESRHPQRFGFDEFYGFLGGSRSRWPADGHRNALLRGERREEWSGFLTTAFAREAVSFVERHRSDPFFLCVSLSAVHYPLDAPAEYAAGLTGIEDPTRLAFAALMLAMDDAVGQILDALRAHGVDENTLLFFVSDNGGPTLQTTSSNRPLRGLKGLLLEGGIRVPMLLRWPARVEGGRVFESPVTALDITPTAMAAAWRDSGAADPRQAFDGVDLLPWIAGDATGEPHAMLFWRFKDERAVRRGRYKWLERGEEASSALYDLIEDPAEQNDLARERPELVRDLAASYDAWDDQMVPPSWPSSDRPDGEVSRRAWGDPERMIRRLDRDGDGRLSPHEYPRDNFHRLDSNGDGFVSASEIEKAVSDDP